MTGRHIAPIEVALGSMLIGAVLLTGYVRHALRTDRPLLDLRLMRFRTFEAGILGGTFFRFGVGASAFLLPLMLQLGFGLDPLRSGLTTFAGAVGALLVKPFARTFLFKFGFRRLLIVNGLLASLTLMAFALFKPTTPHVILLGVLLLGGFLRSLEFTSLSAITYAELETRQISAATGMASVAQQVSISLGVATGAMVLEISAWAAGRLAPAVADYAAAFVVVGLVSAMTSVLMLRLPSGAGDEIAGRVLPPAEPSRVRPA
jgi:MFS family permease